MTASFCGTILSYTYHFSFCLELSCLLSSNFLRRVGSMAKPEASLEGLVSVTFKQMIKVEKKLVIHVKDSWVEIKALEDSDDLT